MTIRIAGSFLAIFAAGLILAPIETFARGGGRGFRAPIARPAVAAAIARPAVARTANRRFQQRRGLAPYGGYYPWYGGYYYYDDQYSSYGSPDQQPMGPAMVYPNQPQTNQPQTNQPQRSGCSTQTYSVPSESGGQRSVKIVTC
jgi:hypothetical protein